MKRKAVTFLGLVLLGLVVLLSACGSGGETGGGGTKREYIVGKNPKTEAVTGLLVSYGSPLPEDAWSYRLNRSGKGELTLTYTRWEVLSAGTEEETVEIPESEWDALLSLLEGEKLVRDPKDDGSVMDGESQTVRLFWNKAPSNYHLELDVNLLQTLINRLRLVYWNHRPAPDLSAAELQSFDFSTTGTYMNAGVEYEVKDELDREENPTGRKLIVYKEDAVAYEDAKVVPCDEAFLEKLNALIQEYGVAAWNGFSMSDPNVLDGTSFGLFVGFKDRSQNISAHGYMSFPPRYRDFRDALEELFKEAVK